MSEEIKGAESIRTFPWSLGHFEDHDEKCFLQLNLIPGWCTCDTYRELRIKTIVDFAMGRIDEPHAYYDQLQCGELDEALRRIREEIENVRRN